jgi:hypothetical protein
LSAFSHDYRTAAARLHAAASGWQHTRYPHPDRGPAGEALSTDVYRLGAPSAKRLLIINSSTHGLEGMLGSAAQLAFVERLAAPGPDLAIVLIHAINPHGFAWRRRVTQEGVDLNRNFIDYGEPPPENPLYQRLAAEVDPDTWPDLPLMGLGTPLELRQAVHAGQYQNPAGSFFGGQAPTWSRRTLEAIYAAEGHTAGTILLVDLHTGAGPWSATECFVAEPAASGVARTWFPGAEAYVIADRPRFGDPTGVPGLLVSSLKKAFPDRTTIAALTECGTYPGDVPVTAIRRSTFAMRHGLDTTATGERWAAEAQEAFCPADPSWRRYALAGVLTRLDQAVAALA